MHPSFGVQSLKNSYDNMPYTGQGGMEWITKRGVFSTPMVIKLLPVKDMSIPPPRQDSSPFDALIYNVKTSLPMGAKVKAIKVVENEAIDGYVSNVKVDYEKQRIRIFVRHKDSGEIAEVYPESVYRESAVRESVSYVLSLSEFIEKTTVL